VKVGKDHRGGGWLAAQAWDIIGSVIEQTTNSRNVPTVAAFPHEIEFAYIREPNGQVHSRPDQRN
jgi:hypothetical protein